MGLWMESCQLAMLVYRRVFRLGDLDWIRSSDHPACWLAAFLKMLYIRVSLGFLHNLKMLSRNPGGWVGGVDETYKDQYLLR